MPKSRSPVVLGISAVALTMLVVGLAIGVTAPPLRAADETAHLDYIVQVWNHRLPVFEQGLRFRPPKPAVIPPVQWESHHPPLFYLLMSPLGGPLVTSGHWMTAVVAVRAANTVLAVGCVLAVAWGAGLLPGGNRGGRALTTAAVATTVGPLIYVAGAIYGDLLEALLSTVAIGISLIAVRRGLSARLIAAAAIVSALGALSGSEYALSLLILLASLLIGSVLNGRGGGLRRVGAAVLAGIVVVLVTAASAGWFYLRNKRLTGNYLGSHPEWGVKHLGRMSHSIGDVLGLSGFQTTQISLLRHPLDGRADQSLTQQHIDTRPMITLFLICVGAGLLVLGLKLRWLRRHRDGRGFAQVAVLVLTMLGNLVLEVQFVTGGGGSISRYLLPSLLPICLLIAGGLRLGTARWRPAVLAFYLLACHGLFVYWMFAQPTTGGRLPTHVPAIALLPVPVLLAGLIVLTVRAARAVELPAIAVEPPRHQVPVQA